MENEQNIKMGRFICELRKSRNLTQKSLAEHLGITDKAVSKWERGLSCPDISLIIPLAKLLGVTVSELLNSEKKESVPQEEVETIVEEALVYSDKNTKMKLGNIKKNILIILSTIFLLAIGICLICDLAITESLTWSLIVVPSLVFSWFLLLPFFKEKRKIVRTVLIVLSLTTIPYLFILSWILNQSLVFKLGTGISVISIIGLWAVYVFFLKLYHRKLCASGISLLISSLVVWGINQIIGYYIGETTRSVSDDMINYISLIILSAVCFVADYYLTAHKKSGY